MISQFLPPLLEVPLVDSLSQGALPPVLSLELTQMVYPLIRLLYSLLPEVLVVEYPLQIL